MTDYEYQKTLMIGAIIGACFILLAFYMLKPSLSPNPPISTNAENHRNFEIVDTYMGCDIIKRENKSVFESQYFMDCRK